ncbi:MAG: helix-hairpin-helix domain-containing protein, partial [Dysgonamonadaceae bacterium]|nr:helix-hairpin-helix domain-containing protein [Dysgonamonadaceae bacterium]
MKSIIITFFLFLCFSAWSQTPEKNTSWMEYLEELSENEMESSLIENLYEELSFLSEHPFNLNTATKQDLERLPFLSEIQIENIQYHIYKYGPLNTIYELKNIDGLDFQTIQYLLPFVLVELENKPEPLSMKNVLKYGKSDLLVRMDNSLQQKAGYIEADNEEKELHPNRFYLGEPYYLSVRYGFQYKDKIQLSFTGEKDAGEAFWNRHHKGFDFHSANLSLKNFGIVEGLYLGDYRVSFGQGLVLNTDFSMGKTSDVSNIGKKNSGIKRHFSTNENDFFRGVAVNLKLKKTNLYLFISHRDLDAGVDGNSISNFKTDGYNRTYNDLEKRHKAEMNTGGLNLQWKNESFQIGTTATIYNFGGKELNPELKPYNFFYLRDKSNYNMSADYSFQRKKLLFQGET